MTTAPTKRTAKRALPRRAAKLAEPAEPAEPVVAVAVPFGAVDRKIGEGAGNLQARSEAYKRRHRLTR